MPKLDAKPIAEKMVEAVRSYVATTAAELSKRIDALAARLAALPAPERGEPGGPGPAGKDADMEAIAKLIDERVAAAVAALPQAKDGAPGPMGPKGDKGDMGTSGMDGESVIGIPGKDGTSVHPDTISLMVREAADRLVASLPRPKDGADGFGLEDFDVELGEDGRTLSMRFVRGEINVERAVKLDTMIYREVWREGDYERGDSVTWDGSIFVALRNTADKPGNSPDWRLAVKRGRDGKDGSAPVPAIKELVRLR